MYQDKEMLASIAKVEAKWNEPSRRPTEAQPRAISASKPIANPFAIESYCLAGQLVLYVPATMAG